MYAGALFIQQIFEWDLYLSVALILAVTVVYTVIGRLLHVLTVDFSHLMKCHLTTKLSYSEKHRSM